MLLKYVFQWITYVDFQSASAIGEPSAVNSTPQPIESTKKPNDRNCKSTGGIVRKYRLSLNKDIRDKYTRKRLIFQDRHAPPDDKQDSSSNPNLEADYSNLFLLPIEVQISELQKQIADKQQRLLILRNQETEMVAIQSDIDTWEAGFRMALEMLCTLRPRFSAQQILHQLGIPDDLVDYS